MTQASLTDHQRMITVSDKEQRLLEELRKVPHGYVEILMVDGQPKRIEKIKESIQL